MALLLYGSITEQETKELAGPKTTFDAKTEHSIWKVGYSYDLKG